jgi:protein SCO1/2
MGVLGSRAMPLPAPVTTPGPTEVVPGAAASSPASIPVQGAHPTPRPARWFGSPWFWGAIVLFGLAMPLTTRLLRPAPEPLPVISELPPFTLTDQDGRAFGKAELSGKVWLAGFIFTRCPTICPALTATMARIQHRARGIEPQFRLVSISVDPAYDTPERLFEFAAKHRASPRMWRFLTGPLDEVRKTVVDGLKIAMGEVEGEQDFASVMHGTHFVLVDQQGQIRGYYPSTDADVVDRVLADAAMLINRGN